MIRLGATTDRLCTQFLLVQVRILQDYGESNGCLEAMVRTSLFGSNGPLQTAGNTQALASHFAAFSQAPKCVCGSFLERISGKERTIRVIEGRGTHRTSPEFPARFHDYTRCMAAQGKSGFACDVCSDDIHFQDALWTCAHGEHTILHSLGFDVCDTCFVRCVSGHLQTSCEGLIVRPPSGVEIDDHHFDRD